ncbi:MAG: hypothetical protein P1U80_05820 [Pseudomonadales bacterium]|nr:hypothetical protein [Pseudomonadales bacterium]
MTNQTHRYYRHYKVLGIDRERVRQKWGRFIPESPLNRNRQVILDDRPDPS